MNNELTVRLFTGSIGFFETASSVHQRDGMFHWPAFYVNLGLAVELSSKAFIAARGACERELREISHCLIIGLNRAVQSGYVVPHDDVGSFLAQINPHYSDHSIRYLSGGSIELCEPEEALVIVSRHIDAIGVQLPVGALNSLTN